MRHYTLCLPLLTAFASQAADDYDLQRAQATDAERWRCNACEPYQGWYGSVGLGVGYMNDDGASRFRNWVPTNYDQGMLGTLNTDLDYRGEGSEYGHIEATDLGLKRFSIATEAGHYDGLRGRFEYRESPYYWNRGVSVYQGEGGVLSAGPLTPFDKETLRKQVSLGLKFTPKSPWQPHASLRHETRRSTLTGYTSTLPGIGAMPGWLPIPQDQKTTLMDAGVSYLAKGWLVDLSYYGSLYTNEHLSLYYGNQANPYLNDRAYEPDNDYHRLTLSGRRSWDRQSLTGRVMMSQATSSGGLNPFANTPVTQDNFNGRVETWQADARWLNRLSRSLTLKASAEHHDRQDKSDRQVVIGKLRPPTDRSHTKGDLGATYRLSRAIKLEGGYLYRGDRREEADRRETDLHTLYVRGRYQPVGPWSAGTRLSLSRRTGSEWLGDSGGSPTLRQYYLADRDRAELRGDFTWQVNDPLTLTAEAWWAEDSYPEPDIGRTQDRDYGVDLSASWSLPEQLDLNLFLNQQWIGSDQQHAYAYAPDWAPYQTRVRDEISTLGLGLTKRKALERDLTLGLDYSYSYGRGRNEASAGYDYPDLTSTLHRLSGYALYQLDERQALKLDLRYERVSDEDYLYLGEEANLGEWNQHYGGYFGGVSWLYHF